MSTVTERLGTSSDNPPPTHRSKWKWPVAVAVLAVAGVLVFALLLDQNTSTSNGSQTLASQRIAATATACEQWSNTYSGAASGAPNSTWCAGFAGWMSGQVAAGHMTGTTTWNNATSMLNACHQWASSTSNAGSAGWCDQMVTWMSQYMGVWGSIHDWDNHMGGWSDQGSGMMNP